MKDRVAPSSDVRLDANKLATRRIVAMFSRGDLSDVDSLFSPQYVDHQRPSIISADGPDEFRQVVALARRSLPNLVVGVEDLIAEGDMVVARLHWNSRGEDGTRIDRETIDILRFSDSQVVEHWGAISWSTESPTHRT